MESATLLALRIPAFEAAIRKAADSRLASRPVAVVTSLRSRGRVLAACPTARDAGVAEEMYYPAAKLACPDAVFLMPDRSLAEQAFQALWRLAATYSPHIEAAGNGCVLLDTRGTQKLWGEGMRVAERARRDVFARLRLPAAVGLAAHRPWSLLASRAAGDRGIREIPPGSEDGFLDHVPVAWIDGITAKTRTRLMEMNIRMAGQLRQFGREHIARQFGSGCGDVLWNVLHPQSWRVGGAGPESVDAADDAIRAEAFLAEATVEEEKTWLTADALVGRVAAVLRRRDLGAARLRLTLLHVDGVVKSAFSPTGGYIQDETALLGVARRLLRRVFTRRVCLSRLWLAAEKLAEPARQKVLFPEAETGGLSATSRPDRKKEAALLHTLDCIRARYGEDTVVSGALARHVAPIILPDRRLAT